METKEIIVRIDKKTGEVILEAQGFHGKGCVKAMEFLKKSLGEMTDFKEKSEYWESNVTGNLNTNLCG